MHEDGYFGAKVAATYDDDVAASDQGSIDAAVDLLFELANGGRALEFAIGTGRIALPLARRGVAVDGIELSQAMVARLRAKEGGAEIEVAIGDMATTRVAGQYLAGLPRLQHDQQSDHAGGADRLFPERRRTSGAGWMLPDRGRRAAAAAAAQGRDLARLRTDRHPLGHRRVRRRDPELHLPSHDLARRKLGPGLRPLSLCVARGAGPDGATGRTEPQGALGQLAAGAVHERQRESRVRLAEARIVGRHIGEGGSAALGAVTPRGFLAAPVRAGERRCR